MNFYFATSAVLFFVGALLWRKENWINFFIKALLSVLSFWGTILALQAYGVVLVK